MKLMSTGPVPLDLPRPNQDKIDHRFRRSPRLPIFRSFPSPDQPESVELFNNGPPNCHTRNHFLDRQSSNDVEEDGIYRHGRQSDNTDLNVASNQSTKISHSEIEKRRRNKLNAYIHDLSMLVPLCRTVHSRKLDKLTILKMSVQYLKNVNRQLINKNEPAEVQQLKTGHHNIITTEDLRQLCLSISDGFFFVVDCSTGVILHVSESSELLLKSSVLLTGANFFDLICPEDIGRVRHQLTQSEQDHLRNSDLSFQEPLAQRSFSCRMLRSRSLTQGQIRVAEHHSSHYVSLSVTGFIKTFREPQTGTSEEPWGSRVDGLWSSRPDSMQIFVAFSRILSTVDMPVHPFHNSDQQTTQIMSEFSCRFSPEARYTAIDLETSSVLGYSLQEIHGSSIYRICHHEDIAAVSESHRVVVSRGGPSTTLPYRLLGRSGQYVTIVTYWQAFRNPFTRIVEAILARSRVVHDHSIPQSPLCLRTLRGLNEYNRELSWGSSDESTGEKAGPVVLHRSRDGFTL